MKRPIKLTESDLKKIVSRIIKEDDGPVKPNPTIVKQLKSKGYLPTPSPNTFTKKTYDGLSVIKVFEDSMYSMCNGENLKFGCQSGLQNCIDVAEILASIPCCSKKR